ncbi:putative HTH-type transcriptional regulator [Actinomadura rubteroloni]|uniref:Putative HTH-type transcriptional regulator n=1 Tax=Actinomadura rubteroloni TaxID=1926885 RepID=A0A2P4UDC7_9ACTN|nr:LuxR C-terminal-related transcriptional regulator [Actinomadura rubteroloni]POM23026.1 putative HTH-type transcriptional regulator [Actinomadura rubteroloni]
MSEPIAPQVRADRRPGFPPAFPGAAETGGGRRGQLPAELTSYVGRRREQAELRELLHHARLVTLTGPAGVGKSRLAARAAGQLGQGCADGAVFVGLAELSDPDRVPDLVAGSLGLRNLGGGSICDVVLHHLRDRQTFIVLDNCEHLLPDCTEFIGTLLERCGRAVVLATSRQSLGMVGERILQVAPLPVPAADGGRPEELEQYDGVRLFVDRATAVCSSFQVTRENCADVARLCRSLDGLPLALELAAARVRVLSPGQIADRLTNRLGLLTKGPRSAAERHRTLRAAVEWSYDLCSPAEQLMWQRLSVFADGFDLEAAEHVCADARTPESAVIDLVDGLLDKSILASAGQKPGVRYRMLATLQEYGRERLAGSGDLARVARAHRDWFAALATAADERWVSRAQSEWAARLYRDLANLRTALEWSIGTPGEAGAAMRMMRRLGDFWAMQGFNAEGRTWLNRAVAAAPADHPDRAWALATNASFTFWMTDLTGALKLLDEADALNGGADELLTGYIAGLRGLAHRRDPRRSAVFAQEAVDIFREHGEARGEMHPLFALAIARAYLGDLAGARAALRRMTALSEAAGDVLFRNMARFAVVAVEVTGGDVDVASRTAREALAASASTRFHCLDLAYCLEALAWTESRRGEHHRAATLFGASAERWKDLGIEPEQVSARAHQMFSAATEDSLGAEGFAAGFATGGRMSDDEAVAYGLETTGAATPRAVSYDPLSERQWEIAQLVAEGLTNRDIAAKLFISPRTAEGHVQRILTRLGLGKRTQIAVWVTRCRNSGV